MTDKTSTQLLDEIAALQQRLADAETRRQQATDAMLKADQRYIDLFENAGDAIILADITSLQILEANKHAARRLGYDREELLQLKLDAIEILPDATLEDSEASWESSFSHTRFYECHYRRKNGSLLPMEVSSRMVSYEGSMVIQNFVRDITRRKEAEREREELISELNAFAHTVAHDLKAPLSIIRGYSNLVLDTFSEHSEEQFLDMLKGIDNGAIKMVRIIDELLLLASTRQSSDVERVPLEMVSVAKEAITRLDTVIEERHAEIVFLDVEAWPVAVGYAPWIEEVWANYVSNAIKYGGAVPRVELGATLQNEGLVCFWVRDNGMGISPGKQAQLFKPVTRPGDIRIQRHGLRLSILPRIINRLGGEVSVESIEDQGSTFSFTLPASTSH